MEKKDERGEGRIREAKGGRKTRGEREGDERRKGEGKGEEEEDVFSIP